MVDVRGLTVRFGDTPAVTDLSVAVRQGEWVGVIGANGAGKTTFLRAVAGLDPYQGTVTLDGREVAELSRRRLARLVAYVPQHPQLPSDMTAVSYVALGRTPHLGYFGSEGPTDRALCLDLLARLALSTMAHRRLGNLSGGEIQRLVLARALAQEAPVLLLDEPTSALDLSTRVEALELVDELRAEHHLTVIGAMHDLTLAAQFADRLVLLSAGSVAAVGSPSEVLDEGSLGRHFGGRVQVIHTDDELVVVPRRTRTRKGSDAHRTP